MSADNVSVLAEKVRNLEEEVRALKADMRVAMEEIDDIQSSQSLILHKLNEIGTAMTDIKVQVSKDSGWRGFFLDFIKAVAQIAVLVGAGKWIF